MPTDEVAADVDRVVANAVLASVRTILVYDASPAVLDYVAARLESQVTATFGSVRRVMLSGHEDDETLFGSWAARGEGELRLAWRPGLIEPGTAEVVAVLHDVSHAGRDVRRALLLTTAGGPVYVERHGQQRSWNARIWWLVACPRNRVGAVSPHLIDRFAVRMGVERPPEHNLTALRAFLATDSGPLPLPAPVPSSPICTTTVDDGAIDRAFDMVRSAGGRGPGLRRALALMRLAIAEARRLGAPIVTAQQIEQSAAALDVPIAVIARRPRQRAKVVLDYGQRENEPVVVLPMRPTANGPLTPPIAHSTAAPRPSQVEEATVARVAEVLADSRYVEDTAPVLRDPETLRASFGTRVTMRGGRGQILGSEPADSLVDLALTDTILAIAWRRLLCPPNATGYRLSPSDLRRHRRAPSPGDLLVVVLDHTALDDWRWDLALTLYLREAYVRRSTVSLIQVGAAPPKGVTGGSITSDELRARCLHLRNVRARALYEAMAAPRGRATPLAHGLELAAQTIRAATTRGRGRSTKIQLVVVSDGRGNVPLTDSHVGVIAGPIRAEGVRDALEVAVQIRALRHVDAVVLHRRNDVHADLPIRLAEALGGMARSPAAGGGGPV